MFKCDHCDKEFETYRGLNGHMRKHGESGGTYKPGSRVRNPDFHCIQCGKACRLTARSHGKYCSSECYRTHQWETVSKPLVESGRGTSWKQVRRYLVERDGYCCSECGLQDWRGKPLSLQIDHIDGNSDNNLPANLRFLCPNCHWQMETTLDRTRKSTRRNDYLREVKKERRKMRQFLENLGIEFNFDPEPVPS